MSPTPKMLGFVRFTLACAALFVVALVWNAVLHLVVLGGVEAAVRQEVYRSDLGERMGLSLLLTAFLVVLFALGYRRFARSGTVREGAAYGVFFALVAGVLVDLNQYVLLPIPGWLAAVWFAGGVVEFTLYGVILSRLLRAPTGRTA